MYTTQINSNLLIADVAELPPPRTPERSASAHMRQQELASGGSGGGEVAAAGCTGVAAATAPEAQGARRL